MDRREKETGTEFTLVRVENGQSDGIGPVRSLAQADAVAAAAEELARRHQFAVFGRLELQTRTVPDERLQFSVPKTKQTNKHRISSVSRSDLRRTSRNLKKKSDKKDVLKEKMSDPFLTAAMASSAVS